MRPEISVILPTFNRSGSQHHLGYLKQALATLRNQYCSVPYEILIGTEVPQQRSEALFDYLYRQVMLDDRIRVFIMRANEKTGHGPTDNFLYEAARGKYLTRPLGDDEVFEPHFLQTLYDALERDPTAVLAYGDFWNTDSIGNILCECKRGEHSHARLMRECYIGIAVLLNRAWFLSCGVEWGAMLAAEDYAMWKVLSRYAEQQDRTFVHVPQFLARWRDWHGNLTSKVRTGEIIPEKDYSS